MPSWIRRPSITIRGALDIELVGRRHHGALRGGVGDRLDLIGLEPKLAGGRVVPGQVVSQLAVGVKAGSRIGEGGRRTAGYGVGVSRDRRGREPFTISTLMLEYAAAIELAGKFTYQLPLASCCQPLRLRVILAQINDRLLARVIADRQRRTGRAVEDWPREVGQVIGAAPQEDGVARLGFGDRRRQVRQRLGDRAGIGVAGGVLPAPPDRRSRWRARPAAPAARCGEEVERAVAGSGPSNGGGMFVRSWQPFRQELRGQTNATSRRRASNISNSLSRRGLCR